MPLSKLIALFFVFAVVAATLPPSEAARTQGFKPADEKQEAPAEPLSNSAQADGGLLHPSASSGSPGTPTLPGFPGLFPPLPGLPGLFPPLPGLPGLFPPLPGLGGLFPPLLPQPGSPPPPQPTDCMTPLLGMMPCTDYLTNLTVLTPPGACCDGLKSIIRDAPICLCHGMNGDLNSFLPKPVDPVRMLILPLACGTDTVIPLQTLFMCSTPQVPPIMPPVLAEPPATPATPSASP